jgi:hypothetical protein
MCRYCVRQQRPPPTESAQQNMVAESLSSIIFIPAQTSAQVPRSAEISAYEARQDEMGTVLSSRYSFIHCSMSHILMSISKFLYNAMMTDPVCVCGAYM